MPRRVPAADENDRVCIELVEFLVEKTKNVTEPMMAWELGREFKDQRGSDQGMEDLVKSVTKCISKIHELPNIDLNTKVKLLFALSAPIDYGFLNELQEKADVTLDSFRRIIEFKAKDETLELKGQHVNTNDANECDMKKEVLSERPKKTSSLISTSEFNKCFEGNGELMDNRCKLCKVLGIHCVNHENEKKNERVVRETHDRSAVDHVFPDTVPGHPSHNNANEDSTGQLSYHVREILKLAAFSLAFLVVTFIIMSVIYFCIKFRNHRRRNARARGQNDYELGQL